MTKPDTGGTAFPVPDISEPGMSIRDWFAGQALQGYIAANLAAGDTLIAQWSYAVADSMRKERNKPCQP